MPNGSKGKGQGAQGAKGRGGKGLDKEHEISRTNPETGEPETRTITQRQWMDEGKDLRAEGWARPEDEDEIEEEVEDEVEPEAP